MKKFFEEYGSVIIIVIATAAAIALAVFFGPKVSDAVEQVLGGWTRQSIETQTSITLTPSYFTYDGTAKIPAVKVKLGSEDIQYGRDFTYEFTDTINAGYGKVTVTYMGNYEGVVSKRYRIQEAEINLNAGDQNYVYNEHPQGAPVTGITVNSQPLRVEYGTTNAYELGTTAPKYTNAGTYTVYYKASAPNHKTVEGFYRIYIEKANPTVTTTPTAKTLTYNTYAQTLINAGAAYGGTMQYKLNTTGTYSTSLPQGTNAGNYNVYYKIKGDSNHKDSPEYSLTVNIKKAKNTLAIASSSGTITYPAQSSVTVNVTKNVAGSAVSVSSSNSNVATCSSINTAFTVNFKNSGTATITVKSAATSNYLETSVSYTVTCKYNTYTVKFNGNGATGGSTADQAFTYNTAQNLRANGYSRTNYTFLGWSTSASATTAQYTNGQSVNNLTSTNGGTVTLYAVWKCIEVNPSIIYNNLGSSMTFTSPDNHGTAVAIVHCGGGTCNFSRSGGGSSSLIYDSSVSASGYPTHYIKVYVLRDVTSGERISMSSNRNSHMAVYTLGQNNTLNVTVSSSGSNDWTWTADKYYPAVIASTHSSENDEQPNWFGSITSLSGSGSGLVTISYTDWDSWTHTKAISVCHKGVNAGTSVRISSDAYAYWDSSKYNERRGINSFVIKVSY